jgi:hypothetical protein
MAKYYTNVSNNKNKPRIALGISTGFESKPKSY